jgi:hypothetical protein
MPKKIEWAGKTYDVEDDMTNESITAFLFKDNPSSFADAFKNETTTAKLRNAISLGEKHAAAVSAKKFAPGGVRGTIERSIGSLVTGFGNLAAATEIAVGQHLATKTPTDGMYGSLVPEARGGKGSRTAFGEQLTNIGLFTGKVMQDPQIIGQIMPKYKKVTDWLAPVETQKMSGAGDILDFSKSLPALVGNAPNLMATVGAGAINPLLGFSVGMAMEYGSAFSDSYEYNNGDVEKASKDALKYGLIAGMLEGLGGLQVGKVAGVAGDWIRPALKTARLEGKLPLTGIPPKMVKVFEIANKVMDSPVGASLSEGITEGLQQVAQDKIIRGEVDFDSWLISLVFGGALGGGASLPGFRARLANTRLNAATSADVIINMRREMPEFLDRINKTGKWKPLNQFTNNEIDEDQFIEEVGAQNGLTLDELGNLELRGKDFASRAAEVQKNEPEIFTETSKATNGFKDGGLLSQVLNGKRSIGHYYKSLADSIKTGVWNEGFTDAEVKALRHRVLSSNLVQVLQDTQVGDMNHLPADMATVVVNGVKGTENFKVNTLKSVERAIFAVAQANGFATTEEYMRGPGAVQFELVKEAAIRAKDPDATGDKRYYGNVDIPMNPEDPIKISLAIDRSNPTTVFHELLHTMSYMIDPKSKLAEGIVKTANLYTTGKKVKSLTDLLQLSDDAGKAQEAWAGAVGSYIMTSGVPQETDESTIKFFQEMKSALRQHVQQAVTENKIVNLLDGIEFKDFRTAGTGPHKGANAETIKFLDWMLFGQGETPGGFQHVARNETWQLGDEEDFKGNLIFPESLGDLYDLEETLTQIRATTLNPSVARTNETKHMNKIAEALGIEPYKSMRNTSKGKRTAHRQAFVDKLVQISRTYKQMVDKVKVDLVSSDPSTETVIIAPDLHEGIIGKALMAQKEGVGRRYYHATTQERAEQRLLESKARDENGRLLVFERGPVDEIGQQLIERRLVDVSGEAENSALYMDTRNPVNLNESGSTEVPWDTYDSAFKIDKNGQRIWYKGPNTKMLEYINLENPLTRYANNGVRSWLNPRQWKTVRTGKFQRWFGNWQNSPETASKVVDEKTGEPKVVYHATKAGADFSTFRTVAQLGVHLGSLDTAETRLEALTGPSPRIYPLFADIKNPIRLMDNGGWGWREVIPQLKKLGLVDQNTPQGNMKDDDYEGVIKILKDLGYDGVVYLNQVEHRTPAGRRDTYSADATSDETFKKGVPEATDSYIVFEANQIKSAYANNGDYSESGSILFSSEKERYAGTSILKDVAGVFANPDDFTVGDLTRPVDFQHIDYDTATKAAIAIVEDKSLAKELVEKVINAAAADRNDFSPEEVIAAGLITNEMFRKMSKLKGATSSHATKELAKIDRYMDAYSNVRSRAGQMLQLFNQRFGPSLLIETLNRIAEKAGSKYGRVLMQMSAGDFFMLEGLNLKKLKEFQEIFDKVEDPSKLTALQKRVHDGLMDAVAGGADSATVNKLIAESIFVMNNDEILADLMKSYFYQNILLQGPGRVRDLIGNQIMFGFKFYAIEPSKLMADMFLGLFPGYKRTQFFKDSTVQFNPSLVLDAYKKSFRIAKDILAGRIDLADYQNNAKWEVMVEGMANSMDVYSKYGNKAQRTIGKTLSISPRVVVAIDAFTRVASEHIMQEAFERRRLEWIRRGIEPEMMTRILNQVKDSKTIQNYMKKNRIQTNEQLEEIFKSKPEELIPMVQETWLSRASAETTFQQKPGVIGQGLVGLRDTVDNGYRKMSRQFMDAAQKALPFVPKEATDRIVAFSPARFLALPFVPTLMNVAKTAFEMAPAGLLLHGNPIGALGIGTTLTWRHKGDLQNTMKELIARQAVANIFMWLVGWAVDRDWLVGEARDQNQADWMRREGIEPYSMKVMIPGDEQPYYVPIPEPFNLMIGPLINDWEAARMVNAAGDEEEAKRITKEMYKKTGSLFLNNSLVREANNLLSSIKGQDTGYGITQRSARTMGNFIPFSGLLRQMNSAKFAYDNGGIAPFTDKTDASIPDLIYTEHFAAFGGNNLGWVKKVPDKVSYFGREIGRGILLGMNVPVSWVPEARLKYAMEPIEQEFGRLDRYPGQPGKEIMGAKLTEDEYVSYTLFYGQLVKEYGNKLVGTPGYKNMNQYGQEKILFDLLEKLRGVSRSKVIAEYPGIRERIVDEKRKEYVKRTE